MFRFEESPAGIHDFLDVPQADSMLAAAEAAVTIAMYCFFRSSTKKRKQGILQYINSLTGSVDAASKSTLINSPLPIMCLLDFTVRWAAGRGIGVAAAHFNHCLRGGTADRDEAFVRDYCGARGIPFASGRGDTRALAARDGLSVEEAARRLRYEFLEETVALRRSTAILTAHHGRRGLLFSI